MDEIVVRIARAAASVPRLRVLSLLMHGQGQTPTRMAKKLRMSLALVSAHLRTLSNAGLLWRRRSGAWCYCDAESPYSENALSGKAMAWLRSALASPARTARQAEPSGDRRAPVKRAEARVHALIIDAATTFGDLRRIQILRRLARGDAVTLQTLMAELSMSHAAASRQTAKLARRGYVCSQRVGHTVWYRLSPRFKSPLHAELFRLVSEEWRD